MADRLYNTAEWKRLRQAVLERDGYVCMVGGPRCSIAASTVDHIQPVSQGGSFWSESNLRAACRRCNFGQGSRVAHQNRRAMIARLEEIIVDQDNQIAQLVEKVMLLEDAARVKPTPSIR